MIKSIKTLALVAGVLMLGVANAYALPAIDGAISPATEWDNAGYTYYLDVTDVNEAGISDVYDIKRVVLFQEYNGLALPDADDGIYILIETYGTPPSLVDAGGGEPPASISMNADFNGDGLVDLTIIHKAEFGPETLSFKRPLGSIFGPAAETFFGTEGLNFKKGSVLEYFIPSQTGGTPHIPFPSTFIGTVVYDNGGDEADDRITGTNTLVPEPGTMFLLGSGLLSMLGFGRFGKK
jgi:hypothetical protein